MKRVYVVAMLLFPLLLTFGCTRLGPKQEKAILRDLGRLDRAESLASDFGDRLRQLILDDEQFQAFAADSSIAPDSNIAGGSSNSAERMNVAPNRKRVFQIHYKFYWGPRTGDDAYEREVDVVVSADYHENNPGAATLYITHGKGKLSQEGALMIQRQLEQAELPIEVKVK